MKVRSDCFISAVIGLIVGIGALAGVATLPERGAPYMHTAPVHTETSTRLRTGELKDLKEELRRVEQARMLGE